MKSPIELYVKKGNFNVEGWLHAVAIAAIHEVAVIQANENIRGPVCEIGVHHGRLFILLHLLTNENEHSAAWDLFDQQNENYDQSGCGDLDQFRENLVNHGCDLDRITIAARNSMDLKTEDIIKNCNGNPRLFSVDGGHTAEITYNDIGLAGQTICENGIIILDDFFNEAWPGVAEGTCRYMAESPGLYPVSIVGNKVMLTNSKAAAEMYIHNLNFTYPGYLSKHTTFFGQDVLCYLPFKTNPIWKHLRDRPLGKLIKRLIKSD
ncbi:MAG: class I SAM-dependent methyltransferase [Balneolales bacterium]